MAVSNSYLPLFSHLQSTLDAHHLRRENIQKASRDITSSAKKLIFALHRSPLPDQKALQPHYNTVKKALKIAGENMPSGDLDQWRYKGQMSPGMQELVEALLFEQWVMGIEMGAGKVMDWEETRKTISVILHNGEVTQPDEVLLTWEDYVLGLLDFTGEVMRYCITSIAHDGHQEHSSVESDDGGKPGATKSAYISGLETLREIHAQLNNLSLRYSPFGKEFNLKMEVLEGSIEKIENAVYSQAVRRAESTILDHRATLDESTS